MMRVLLEAPILTRSGYGEHARLVYKALKRNKNIEVMVNPLNWGATAWDVPEGEVLRDIQAYGSYINDCETKSQNHEFGMQIHVGIPNEFSKKAPYSICITAGIETDRVDPGWLIKTHQGIDKIIVPSEHAKSGFVATRYEITNKTNNTSTEVGCACPVDVIPYPTKNPTGPALDIDFDTDFNFLTIAMMGPRKNLEMTIGGFIEEFRDNENVGLIVKTSAGRSSLMDREKSKAALQRLIATHGEKKCKVYFVHGELSESEIHSLYTHPKIKAYVSTTHGEGYGLPIFEAAYSGMPVIATDWSGHLDFLSGHLKGKAKKLFARVGCDIKPVQKVAVWENIITADSRWAYVKENSYRSQLGKVYNNYGMYKKWAEALKGEIVDTHKIEDVLDQYLVSIFGTSELKEKESIENLRSQALEIEDPKLRASFVKSKMSEDMSQTDKIDFLKDLFKGETAYVLSCGPTLTDHNPEKIKNILKDNLGVSIKQSFDLFGDLIDFHIYNCANFKQYDYSKNSPVVVEASTTPYRLGSCDLKFFIRERDFNKSTAAAKDYDSWTLDSNPLLRPYGPGIMYEVVFYTLQHMGVSEIITIGWDNKLIDGDASQQHFYDKKGTSYKKEEFIHNNEVAANAQSVASLDHEAKITTDAIASWSDWLKSKGTTLKIISSINPAPDQIERLTL
jgi:glycosyltransferase involved in cell wall biosynthesis